MPIKITCPHCKRGMSVDERMAGKKGRCKACQQILTVPMLATGTPQADAAPKAAPPPPPPADVETEAAALFADEPKPVETPVDTKTIDFNCPFCDEAIHLPVDLAGKRAPCPECKNIIKVPEKDKKDPKDWRKVEARGPSGARLPEQPELEGAWGSTKAAAVGKQTLVEAGVIPQTKPPQTVWQKVRWPVLGVTLLIVLSIGGWMGFSWWRSRGVTRALNEALAYASSAEAKPVEQAALTLGAGEYYRRDVTPHPNGVDNGQFGKTFNTLRSAAKSAERDALLADLALAEVELGGDKAEVDKGFAVPWDKTQQQFEAALREINDGEVRLQALQAVAQRLRARGQSERILPMTNRIYSANDGDTAAALSVIGMDFLNADDKAKADKAAQAALLLYDAKPPPPLRAEFVALALTLKMNKVPKPSEEIEDKANEYVGQIEALARKGEWDAARKQTKENKFDEIVRFRARLVLAAAAVDAKVPDSEDIESAMKMAEDGLSNKPELSWSLFRLIELALRANVPEDRIQTLADKIGNVTVRGRAQLAVFRARLAKSKQPVEDAAADKIDAKTLSNSLAGQALARHNTRWGANYSGVVQSWPQPRKAFGLLGVALGSQDREK